jgi:hypothetical protein
MVWRVKTLLGSTVLTIGCLDLGFIPRKGKARERWRSPCCIGCGFGNLGNRPKAPGFRPWVSRSQQDSSPWHLFSSLISTSPELGWLLDSHSREVGLITWLAASALPVMVLHGWGAGRAGSIAAAEQIIAPATWKTCFTGRRLMSKICSARSIGDWCLRRFFLRGVSIVPSATCDGRSPCNGQCCLLSFVSATQILCRSNVSGPAHWGLSWPPPPCTLISSAAHVGLQMKNRGFSYTGPIILGWNQPRVFLGYAGRVGLPEEKSCWAI